MRVLLVIPNYRDAARLEPFLRELVTVLPREVGVMVSDDGSGAAEVAKMQNVVECIRPLSMGPLLLDPLVAECNRGKGAAVYAGWQAGIDGAGGVEWDALAFADADGAVSAREILRGVMAFRSRGDATDGLIGSRIKMLGRNVERKVFRHLSGRLFATFVSLISGLTSYDTQCGFKIFRRVAVERILPKATAFGFAFDVELLLLAQRSGFRTEEFPVDWRDVDGGKVNVFRDALPMLVEVWRAREAVEGMEIDD
jgi:dolichyl-phosphate beta-glucosyltransferase